MAAELAGGAIGELRPACSASTGRNTTAILTAQQPAPVGRPRRPSPRPVRPMRRSLARRHERTPRQRSARPVSWQDIDVVELTPRLSRRIQRDFLPRTAEQVVGYLTGLSAEAFGGQDAERVLAAIVLAAEGEWDRFTSLFSLLRLDWRDVLVAGGLADADWPARLEAELGSR